MPLLYPNAVWKPVGNFGYPRGTHGQLRPVAIVDHIAQGTMIGMYAWFSNPASEASAHFGVGKRGEVHQYVSLIDAAWANGKKSNPDDTIPWMAEGNPNLVTVSIEHEGKTGEAWTEAMYASDLALHRWLVDTLGIPVDDNHIIGHYRIDSVNRSRCPGMGWPRTRLFRDLKEVDDMVMSRKQFDKWFYENLGAWFHGTQDGSFKKHLEKTPEIQKAISGAAMVPDGKVTHAIHNHEKLVPHGGGGSLLSPKEMADALKIIPK